MLKKEELLQLYRTMLLIRMVENRINDEYKYDEMKTPIHLSIGQEAIAAGVCLHLKRDDQIFGTHRSHAQYIAKGGDLKKMIAEMYLRRTGCSQGRGGSMHLVDPDAGIPGSTAIVGGNIPLGTGAALAAALQKTNKVTAVFFGDGAVDEGTFHESLNFAALKKLPVLYVCENNKYAIMSPVSERHSGEIYTWAKGYDIPSYQINGNDVLEVSAYAERAIERCRNGEGPTFLECITYRWKGHIGTVNDIGEGYRPQSEYDYWVSKCPIKWFSDYLRATGVLDDDLDDTFRRDISALIENAFDEAKAAPKPQPEEIMDYVYAD